MTLQGSRTMAHLSQTYGQRSLVLPLAALRRIDHRARNHRRIVEAVCTSVILAGGLGPDNVAQAIGLVGPDGVDSKTNTDREGSHAKDLERVRRFYKTAREAIVVT